MTRGNVLHVHSAGGQLEEAIHLHANFDEGVETDDVQLYSPLALQLCQWERQGKAVLHAPADAPAPPRHRLLTARSSSPGDQVEQRVERLDCCGGCSSHVQVER
eukprot:258424-Hanusia_phi.AAC.1